MNKGFWDIHNHMLPGLDDGASCMEETHLLVEEEYRQGIRRIIFTPHFRTGMFEVSKRDRERIYLKSVSELTLKFPDMKFYLGCEYYVHSKDECKDMLPYCILGTKAILIEFSTKQTFQKISDTVREFVSQGIVPILAHVERYTCLLEKPNRVGLLQRHGARIQINAESFIGKNGFDIKRFCKQQLKMGYVDFIASDAHDTKKRVEALGKCIHLIEKKYGSVLTEQLFINNPETLFGRN